MEEAKEVEENSTGHCITPNPKIVERSIEMTSSTANRDSLSLPLPAIPNTNGTNPSNGSSNSAAGVPTLTTPTLTPTTLRNIEQMFLLESEGNAEAAFDLRPPDPHENAARFEPPAVTGVTVTPHPLPLPPPMPTPSAAVDVKQEWPPEGASVLPGPHSNEKHLAAAVLPGPSSLRLPTVPAAVVPLPPPLTASPTAAAALIHPPPQIVLPDTPIPPPQQPPLIQLPTVPLKLIHSSEPAITRPAHINNNHGGINGGGGNGILGAVSNGAASSGSTPPRPPTDLHQQTQPHLGKSTRRPNPADATLPPEELEKKLLRRQRNKEAAARCRKRRLDQTMTLQEEVDCWEERSAELREEIRALEEKKGQLQALLTEHRPVCAKVPKAVKEESVESSSS